VLSLLTEAEEESLELHGESGAVEKNEMKFLNLPISDRQVPRSDAEFGEALEKVNGELSGGRNVLVHCRQGIGRSGLVAACLLVKKGMSPGPAVEVVSAARGLTVPETPEQRNWIDRYAVSLSVLK
jgi:protein-tyrosine phosphatase